MPEKNPVLSGGPIVAEVDSKREKDPVCIHTRKIYDACRELHVSCYRCKWLNRAIP